MNDDYHDNVFALLEYLYTYDYKVVLYGEERGPVAELRFHVRIYATGDASSFARPAIHNIISAVPILCANLECHLAGGEDRVFRPDERQTQFVLLGRRKAVGAAIGWSLPRFVVRLLKSAYWLWTTPNVWSSAQWTKEM